MITKLTKAQEKQIPKYVQKYIDLASKPTDRKAATLAVQNLYENAGEEKPIVIFAKSPLQAAIMVAMCKILFKEELIKDDSQLGSQLDSQLGSQLDSQLRSQLRSQLYSQLYSQLDSQLDSQLGSQLGSQLDSQLRSQLYSQLYSQLGSQLGSQLDSQLGSQLDSQLYSQLGSQLRSQLGSQLRSQLRSQLDSQLRSQLGKINNDWWIVFWWLVWAGWYAFGEYIGVKFDSKVFKIFIDFVTNVSFIIPYKGIAFVSETPKQILWENQRLSSSTSPAVEYADGYSLYSLNGVTFEKELWEKVVNDKLSPKEVFAIKNTEQRRIAYEYMDKLKMKDLKDYTVLDHREKDEQGNMDEVVQFSLSGFDEPFLYYHCQCPTTGRRYFIQTEKKTCLEAKNMSFGVEKIEWTNEW